ncbi:MAG: hypothetical protein Q9M91_07295 [Candidatus Dojkabacteria bacterium]|nr:hypothetical protein [Candidatus Dojkabacteria bacterium]
MEKAAAIPVIAGHLLDDNFTNAMVVLQNIRHLAKGKNVIDNDTWPRSMGQAAYLNDKLIPLFRDNGITLNSNMIQVEAVTSETARVMRDNPEEAKLAHQIIGNRLERIRKAEGVAASLDELAFSDADDKNFKFKAKLASLNALVELGGSSTELKDLIILVSNITNDIDTFDLEGFGLIRAKLIENLARKNSILKDNLESILAQVITESISRNNGQVLELVLQRLMHNIDVGIDINEKELESINLQRTKAGESALNIDDFNVEVLYKITADLIKGRRVSFERMVSRAFELNREDDKSHAAVAKRLASYDNNTVQPARDMGGQGGVIIIPGAGSPEEAIEEYLKAQVIQRDPDYDFSTDNVLWTDFVERAKRINRNSVENFTA